MKWWLIKCCDCIFRLICCTSPLPQITEQSWNQRMPCQHCIPQTWAHDWSELNNGDRFVSMVLQDMSRGLRRPESKWVPWQNYSPRMMIVETSDSSVVSSKNPFTCISECTCVCVLVLTCAWITFVLLLLICCLCFCLLQRSISVSGQVIKVTVCLNFVLERWEAKAKNRGGQH